MRVLGDPEKTEKILRKTDKFNALSESVEISINEIGTIKQMTAVLDDIKNGRKYMKVYRQMKMYNDPSTNPILYKKQ